MDVYAQRRARLLARMGEGVALFPTARPQRRNGDSDFRFRPDSDFYYLTGFEEPDALLVLAPGRTEGEQVLFLRPKHPEEEVWSGRRLGVERAVEALGVDQAFPIGELDQRLPGLVHGRDPLWYRTGPRPDMDRRVLDLVSRLRLRPQQAAAAPTTWKDPALALHEMRLVKDEAELALHRTAAAISAEAHVAALRLAAPGVAEYEVEALVEYTFRRRGGTAPAYGTIVASGPNATVLHYVRNDRRMQDGELLLLDAGCEYGYYACDVTRTFPVGTGFTPAQRRVYDLVLGAQQAALACVVPGRRYSEFHDAAVAVLAQGLVDLGLLPGPLEAVLEGKTYRRFYMHNTGHWLGLDVHDAGTYFEDATLKRRLAPGMLLTVEPGLYVAPDDATVPEEYRGIGVRIEDDVLVTAAGHEVLTAAIPKQPDELLALKRG